MAAAPRQHDDESFKKAYTDAVGNALKFLGMSADIRMGQLDDTKYVQELHWEKTEKERQNQTKKPAPRRIKLEPRRHHQDDHSLQTGDHFAHLGGGADDPIPFSLKSAKEIAVAVDECQDLTNLALIDTAFHQVISKLSERAQITLMDKVKAREEELMTEQRAAA